ncbi:hypothetical protein HNQ07_003273 [Deinococcus metalli]|uniref:Haloperoxidase n=1 Tax=Deinococcus metalli TaxID=1141878 RepID=A0A7W8KJN6_9DEIO|nr:vanadium-dependent haloperoxidase [Deinococcus metalli]MBB5377774.1 hypothetical protein [Deinococcus metalli]GHF53257.1 haloperoxidase [Deinococcus metalli]
MTDTPSVVWNEIALEAIRAAPPGPPVAARALFMLHAAIFDAWAAYDRTAVGLHWKAQTRRPAAEHSEARQRTAMAYAACRVLSDLFPARAATFAAVLDDLGLDAARTDTNPATPHGVGNLAAAEVLADRHGDGSNQLHEYADTTGYAPVNTPERITDGGRWQPLRVSDGYGGWQVQSFVAPHWGTVTPFALSRPDQFQPAPPARWGTPEFLEQVREVLAYSATLTPIQQATADYWADGPGGELPPGHWTLFATFVSERDGHDAAQDARMFLAVTGAVMDAGVSCWDAKRHYDYAQPASAVRSLLRGRALPGWDGPGNHAPLASAWRPGTGRTPPFAEYTSGHSTFSAAAATALRLITGSDVFGHGVTLPVGHGDGVSLVRLTWATFSDAADEAGLSRRYGGLHFRDADLAGRAAGRQIGQLAVLRALHHFNPKLHPLT